MTLQQSLRLPIPRHRRGVSLIECLIVMTVSSAMLSVAVATLYALFEAEKGAGRALEWSITEPQISFLFRSDVRAARDVVVEEIAEGHRLVLTHEGDKRVTYSATADRLVRIAQSDNALARTETFSLPGYGADFVVNREATASSAPHVILTIPLKAAQEGHEPREFRVIGQVGRDHRFAEKEATP